MKASLKFLVIPLAVGALLAGCGSDSSSSDSSSSDSTTQTQATGSGGAKADVVALSADPSSALAYDTDTLSAKAGKVAIDFTNEASIPHNVVIEDSSGKEVASTPTITGQSATAEFDAKPGTYTYYCSIPGHEAAGMKGTLTVKS